MTAQQFILKVTTKTFNDFFEACAKVPIEKHDWKPLDNGRSVLDQAREVALCPLWVVGLLKSRGFNEADFAQQESLKDSLDSLAKCQELANENLKAMQSAIETFPESDIEVEADLPWGRYSMIEMMNFPYWNTCYHFGQINYIQTLYGDFSM
jgi:hypothetical protein